jgi:hypothetical protein
MSTPQHPTSTPPTGLIADLTAAFDTRGMMLREALGLPPEPTVPLKQPGVARCPGPPVPL